MVISDYPQSDISSIYMSWHRPLAKNRPRKNQMFGTLKSVWDLARMFGRRTTIHGINRLLEETAGRYERFIWFLTVFLAFIGSIYVCIILSDRFKEGKLQTVVDSTRMPVYKIYFPVITICNLNRLNWARIDEAKNRFLPNESSVEKLLLFERIVSTYDDMGFANFVPFAKLEDQPLHILNHINFSLVVDFMTWRCEEFLVKCLWRRNKINCCQVFSKRRTKIGLCWAFNSLETEEGRRMQRLDPMWPWRTGGAGPTSALKLRVLINPEKHYPYRINKKGLSIMVSEPYVWHMDHIRVYEKTETLIAIEPVKFFHDNDTKSISSEHRRCVFENEQTSSDFKSLHNYIYMYENCQAECHQEYLMRYCNCTVDLLFPPGQYPSCKVKDLPCLAQNNDHFLFSHQPDEREYVRNAEDGMSCKCLWNCYSFDYLPDVRSSIIPPRLHRNRSYVDLDVHYRYDTLMVYRTSLIFGWVDLLVAFGGIAGLFLGCSLISAMELIYFACVEMPNFFFEQVTQSRQQRSQYQDTQRGIRRKFGSIMPRNMTGRDNELNESTFKRNSFKTFRFSERSQHNGKFFYN